MQPKRFTIRNLFSKSKAPQLSQRSSYETHYQAAPAFVDAVYGEITRHGVISRQAWLRHST